MRDKNVAGILALFFGWIGIHRFYLGQVGLGILYALLFWSGISAVLGLIDAIVFFSMDKDAFDIKYNPRYFRVERRKNTDFDRQKAGKQAWNRHDKRRRDYQRRTYRRPGERAAANEQKNHGRTIERPNPYKATGIKKYRDYDYDGAIEEFRKALEIDPRDVAVHFNLACAYSLNEKTQEALSHLDKAVHYGFDDFKRIEEHDALAFLRIQPDFQDFRKNDYRLVQQLEQTPVEEEMVLELEPEREEEASEGDDLLEQLNKLGELRDKGLLTEAEFSAQKKKLLSG